MDVRDNVASGAGREAFALYPLSFDGADGSVMPLDDLPRPDAFDGAPSPDRIGSRRPVTRRAIRPSSSRPTRRTRSRSATTPFSSPTASERRDDHDGHDIPDDGEPLALDVDGVTGAPLEVSLR